MIYIGLLFILTFLTIVAQDFIPVIHWAYDARVFIVPIVFLSGALITSFRTMLLLAFFTGFIWDALHVVVPDGEVTLAVDYGIENKPMLHSGKDTHLSMGYSIFLYGLLGSFMQGVRPYLAQGKWGIPILMTGLSTSMLMLLEYLFINFKRGNFYFPSEVWYKVITTGLLSMVFAPMVIFLFYHLAMMTNYRIRYEGLISK